MNKISDNSKSTLVKVLINILASASLVFSHTSYAAPTGGTETTPATPAAGATQPTTQANPPATSVNDLEIRQLELCARYNDKIDEATRKIGESCRKAGLSGSSNCVEKARACGEASGEESFDTMGALTTALGSLGVTGASSATSSGQKGCAQMSGRDYYTEKDRVEKELKDLEKELGDLDKEKADAKKEYDENMNEYNEALSKAQEDYKAKELEIDASTREKIAEFNKTQSDIKEALRNSADETLKLEGQLIAAQRDKAQKMITMSETAAKRTCQKEVAKARADYLSVSGGSTGNHISNAKEKKQILLNTYKECMSQYDQERVKLNESKDSEYQSLNRQLDNLKAKRLDIEESLALADSQLKEIQDAATKEKSNALQAVVDLGTRTQEKMKAAYENLTANQAAIDKKIAGVNAAINRANNSITAMGPVPTSRGSDYSPGEAASDIESNISIIANASRSAPPQCAAKIETYSKEALKKLGTK